MCGRFSLAKTSIDIEYKLLSDNQITTFTVSKRVNSPANNDESLS